MRLPPLEKLVAPNERRVSGSVPSAQLVGSHSVDPTRTRGPGTHFRRSLSKSEPAASKPKYQTMDESSWETRNEVRCEQEDTEASTSSYESLVATEPQDDPSSPRPEKYRRQKRRAAIYINIQESKVPPVPSLSVTYTTLIDLAMMQNWDQLLVNLKFNRNGARRRDADGLFPLHWAVTGGPPLEVVRALVKAYPGATKKVDMEGSNPMHFATHYGGSAEVMEVLIKANPKAVCVQDKYGRSPLYHAVDKSANIQVLSVLAKADPRMITVSCRPTNYQQLENEGKRWDYLTPLYLAWVNFLTDKRSVETCSGKIWEKACLLLKLAFCDQKSLPLDTDVSLMTAMVALDPMVPEELAAVVIELASSQDLLSNDPITGKNPLALVASSENLSPERADELIRLLLDACPGAAAVLDKDGQTALANAARSGKGWDLSLKRLFNAFPDALLWSDKTTGLPPPLLLASSSPHLADANQGTGVLLADPYSLVGVKALSMKRIALERRRQGETNSSPPPNEAAPENVARNQHLSSLFQILREDPSCIVAVE